MAQFHRTSGRDGERIEIRGRFDFQNHQAWRALLEALPASVRCTVDLSQTSYVDSSALGMLLMLRERSGETVLVGPNEDLRAIFDIARFDKVFRVEPAA